MRVTRVKPGPNGSGDPACWRNLPAAGGAARYFGSVLPANPPGSLQVVSVAPTPSCARAAFVSASSCANAARARNGVQSVIRFATRWAARPGLKLFARLHLAPLAVRNALWSTLFGSGNFSQRCGGGRPRSSVPDGRPAASRRAASSCSSHASCILTGTTPT